MKIKVAASEIGELRDLLAAKKAAESAARAAGKALSDKLKTLEIPPASELGEGETLEIIAGSEKILALRKAREMPAIAARRDVFYQWGD